MTLNDYLIGSYDWVTGKKTMSLNVVEVMLCYTHLMDTFTKNLKETKFYNQKQKN